VRRWRQWRQQHSGAYTYAYTYAYAYADTHTDAYTYTYTYTYTHAYAYAHTDTDTDSKHEPGRAACQRKFQERGICRNCKCSDQWRRRQHLGFSLGAHGLLQRH
jgi:hypothetical protein